MNTSVVILNSYTAAKKAARYLSSVKIPARVEKISGFKGGCAYGVRTAEEPEKVCRMLAVIGVSCRGSVSDGQGKGGG